MPIKKPPAYLKIDHILNLFNGYYPYGANYFSLTYKLNFEAEEWEAMFEFMMDEFLIEPWGEDIKKQIITEKGIVLINLHCGVQKYIEQWQAKTKVKPETKPKAKPETALMK